MRPKTKFSSGNPLNSHQFPWFSHINVSNASENFVFERGALSAPYGAPNEAMGDEGSFASKTATEYETRIFALGNTFGFVKISNELITNLTNATRSEAVPPTGHQMKLSNGVTETYGSEHGVFELQKDISNSKTQKVSKYFEVHYKYTYSIRTSQDLKLEYLRLPQSSIQKNEWKAFFESSI